MTRLPVLVFAALFALAPLSGAEAQDRGPRGGDRGQPQSNGDRPRMGAAQAQSIAQARARAQIGNGDPRDLVFRGLQRMEGSTYIFLFEHNGRVFEIAVGS